MSLLWYGFVIQLLFCIFPLLLCFSVAGSKPNIVIILVDDLGINDTSIRVEGATSLVPNGILSPHFLNLRESGVLLTDHTVFKFCSPSRSQLLSGRYAYHLGQQTYANLPLNSGCGLNAKYMILPLLLKDQGYWTIGLGKWHQGLARREFLPTERGFDRFVGLYAGGQTYFTHIAAYSVIANEPTWWTPAVNDTLPNPNGCTALWDVHNDSSVLGLSSVGFALQVNGTYSTELTATAFEVALEEYARKAPNAPLFAYVAFHGVHLPLEVPDKYLQRYLMQEKKVVENFGEDSTGQADNLTAGYANMISPFGADIDRQKLAAMVTAVDDALGRIILSLKQRSMYNNTIILLTTDNGAPVATGEIGKQELTTRNCGGSNGLLRGSKMTDWQGGVRGLTLLSGGLIPPSRHNSTYSGMVHQTDWYASFAAVGGVSEERLWNKSGPITPDSVAGILHAILHDEASPRTELVHNINGKLPGAIRVGNYKLVNGDPNLKRPYNGYNGWNNTALTGNQSQIHPCTKRACLFNIVVDPHEQQDLADEDPQVSQ